MSGFLGRYLDLEREMFRLRAAKKDETQILDEMDHVWINLSKEERDYIQMTHEAISRWQRLSLD